MCRRSAILASLVWLGLASCSDPDDPVAGAEIQIGTGALEFEALEPGEELVLEAGPQGGYHFVINARIRNLIAGDPEAPGLLGNPLTRFSIYLEDGRRIDANVPPYRLGYKEHGDGWYTLTSGRILQLDQTLVIEENLAAEILGQDVQLRVHIRDARGDEASDEVWVVPTSDATPDAIPDAGLFIDAGVDAGP